MAEQFYAIKFPGFPWDYASASAKSKALELPCAWCGYGFYRWTTPLVIQWEEGSKVIGDFTPLGGGSHVLVSDRVRLAVEGRFAGFDLHPVKMAQDKRLDNVRKPRKDRVLLPYTGPPLWWFEPTLVVPMRHEDYQWEIEMTCVRCGKSRVKPPSGFEINYRDAKGYHVFRLELAPARIYMTKAMKDFLIEMQSTNLASEYAGVITQRGEEGRYFGSHVKEPRIRLH